MKEDAVIEEADLLRIKPKHKAAIIKIYTTQRVRT